MTILVRVIWAAFVIALLSVAPRAEAGAPQAERAMCEGMTPDDAERQARIARKNGDHRLAAECFTVAGDYGRANREFVRAAEKHADIAERNTRKAAERAKAQARRLAQAFR